MTIAEKAAYLKGLADGLDLKDTTPEGKVLLGMVGLVQEMARQMQDSDGRLDELAGRVSDVEEDLDDIDEILYGEDGDGYEDGCDDGDECEDGCEDDGSCRPVECPSCHSSVSFDGNELREGGLKCPICGEPIECDPDKIEGR